eukprot:scaffold243863_cov22-Tisochrysis_lutea.AAC.1
MHMMVSRSIGARGPSDRLSIPNRVHWSTVHGQNLLLEPVSMRHLCPLLQTPCPLQSSLELTLPSKLTTSTSRHAPPVSNVCCAGGVAKVMRPYERGLIKCTPGDSLEGIIPSLTQITGMPVVNDARRVVGIISKKVCTLELDWSMNMSMHVSITMHAVNAVNGACVLWAPPVQRRVLGADLKRRHSIYSGNSAYE